MNEIAVGSGLIKGYECQFVKPDKELIDAIAQKIQVAPEKVRALLRYNMFTVAQFSKLTGLSVMTINNKMRLVLEKGEYTSELDYCFPFASDAENPGPKFIVRNEKAEIFLKGVKNQPDSKL